MKPLDLGLAVTCSMVLLIPLAAAAQEAPSPSPTSSAVVDASPLPEVSRPCAPLVGAAGDDPSTAPSTASPSPEGEAPAQIQPAGFCVRDLIAVGPAKVKAKSIGIIEPAPNAFGNLKDPSAFPFGEGLCANPAKAGREDLGMMCLLEVGNAWREWQRAYRQEGLVPQLGFDSVLPAYQYAVSQLDKRDLQSFEAGLSRLDELPIDWVRPQPQDLKSRDAVRKAAVRRADPRALNRKLHEAWFDTMTPVLEGEDAPGLPRSYWGGPGAPTRFAGQFDPGGLSIVNWCQVAIQANRSGPPTLSLGLTSHTCAEAAAQAWLMYETTGDARFLDVAVGIRSMALTAMEQLDPSGFYDAKEWNSTFSCWLDPDAPQGCPVGF